MMPLDLTAWAENADSYPVVLYVASPDGFVRWVNRYWETLTGIPEHDALGSAWMNLVHPNQQTATIEGWKRSIASGAPFSTEVRLRVASGAYRWVLSRTEPVRAADGTLTHWVGVVLDIDDLKQYQRSLLKSEVKFRELADNIDLIVLIADSNWRATYFNRRWTEYTGIPAEEAVDLGWERGLREKDVPFITSGMLLAEETGSLSFVHQLYHAPTQEHRWVHMRAHRVAGSHGDDPQWFVTLSDIHDQKLSIDTKNRVIDTFQQALLPRQIALVPNVGCSSVYVAASEESRVGGDWYDCFDIGDGRFGISIGDVIGHGITASATMSRVRQYISTSAEYQADPRNILQRCNGFVFKRDLPVTTAIVGILDLKRRTFEFASAGHPSLVIVHENHAELSKREGLPLGVEPDARYESSIVLLDGVKMLVLYTDGILEYSRDIIGTEQRIVENSLQVARLPNPVSAATEIVRRTMRGARPNDDVAMIVFSFGDGEGAIVSHRLGRTLMSWSFDSHEQPAAYRSRDQMLSFLSELSLPGSDLGDVKYVIGELVANVVEHAPGPVHAEIDWAGDHPLLRMRNAGPGFKPDASLPDDPMSEGGRGLFLVAALADDLRVTSHFEGDTEVSVRLRLHKANAS